MRLFRRTHDDEELGDDGAIHELALINPKRLALLREIFGDPDPGKDQIDV